MGKQWLLNCFFRPLDFSMVISGWAMAPIFGNKLKKWVPSTSSTVAIDTTTTSVPTTLLMLVETLAMIVIPDYEELETTDYPNVDGDKQPKVDYLWFAVSIFVISLMFWCFWWLVMEILVKQDVVFVFVGPLLSFIRPKCILSCKKVGLSPFLMEMKEEGGFLEDMLPFFLFSHFPLLFRVLRRGTCTTSWSSCSSVWLIWCGPTLEGILSRWFLFINLAHTKALSSFSGI